MSRAKPTALKLLDGNPGKRALNKNEPIPERDLKVDPPQFLGEVAAGMWRHIVNESAKGVLKNLDVGELTMYCAAFEIWKDCYEQVRLQGSVVLSVEKGIPSAAMNPYLRVMNTQAEIMSRTGNAMGLSPIARSRLSVEPAQKTPNDPFSKLLTSRSKK